jgi:hypothetical protein
LNFIFSLIYIITIFLKKKDIILIKLR